MKRKKQKIYVLIVLLIIMLILLLANILYYTHHLTIAEKYLKDTANYISSIFTKKETQLCNLDNKYLQIKEEYEQLKQLLDIEHTLIDYNEIYAAVINRNINYYYDVITINKGQNQNIKLNQAVVYNNNLIGKVSSVSNNTSTVILITNNAPSNKISVRIKTTNGYAYGLLDKYIDGYYIIEGIDQSYDIKEKDVVLTTGLSDIYPANLIIGEVTKVEKDNFDLSDIIYVKSNFNIDDLRYVTILERQS